MNEAVPDERTPLLKKESAKFNDVVPCIGDIDEEAARVLVDKPPSVEESRNIAGVISILLIGASTDSLQEIFFFPLKSLAVSRATSTDNCY
jgi:hypothetical protein